MYISEVFYSIQGEGILTGVPSIFIRTSGCNLRCWFCDTDYTSWQAEGTHQTNVQILDAITEFPTQHVVITGGEPLLQTDLPELCQILKQRQYHITIETAATIYKPIACDLASLSPKLTNSTPNQREEGRYAQQHEQQRLNLKVIQQFMEHCSYQLKFVVDQPADIDEVLQILKQLQSVDKDRVLLMPQGVTSSELNEKGRWIVDLCKQHGFRYCPRIHIDLYGNTRAT